MSSIKLSPNASGTGEFTIAAPNTNTNRTLTLPDQTGTIVSTDSSGAVVLPRVDSSNEGGQINFNRALDNVANWSIDSFGNTTTPTLRFIDSGNVRMALDGAGNLGLGVTPSAWGSLSRAFQIGQRSAISNTNTVSTIFAHNWYANSSNADTYIANDFSSVLRLGGGTGGFQFFTAPSGTAGNAISFTQAMTLTSGGLLQVGTTTFNNGLINTVTASGLWGISIRDNAANTAMIQFVNSGGAQAGTITISGTTTNYGSGSDYRLKENIAPMTGALEKVQSLKPVTWKWKADGSDGQGFIAHELADVYPDAVVGEKDAVNEDGSIKPQMVDTSFLVATLTAAIQELAATSVEQQAIISELNTRIAALDVRINSLEAK